MTYINPISGTAMAATVQQEQLTADKTRQLRQQQQAKRNVAAAADHFEHAVENAEEVAAIHEEKEKRKDPRSRQPKKQPAADQEAGDDVPHIDLLG